MGADRRLVQKARALGACNVNARDRPTPRGSLQSVRRSGGREVYTLRHGALFAAALADPSKDRSYITHLARKVKVSEGPPAGRPVLAQDGGLHPFVFSSSSRRRPGPSFFLLPVKRKLGPGLRRDDGRSFNRVQGSPLPVGGPSKRKSPERFHPGPIRSPAARAYSAANWFIVLCAPPALSAASPAKYSL